MDQLDMISKRTFGDLMSSGTEAKEKKIIITFPDGGVDIKFRIPETEDPKDMTGYITVLDLKRANRAMTVRHRLYRSMMGSRGAEAEGDRKAEQARMEAKANQESVEKGASDG